MPVKRDYTGVVIIKGNDRWRRALNTTRPRVFPDKRGNCEQATEMNYRAVDGRRGGPFSRNSAVRGASAGKRN